MKLFSLFLLISFAAYGQSTQNSEVGSPANAVSRGQSENSGVSDSPTGPTQKDLQEQRERAESMGGAPNAGGGMGTGTGAGSTIGKELNEGNLTAGAVEGADDNDL